MRSVIITYLLAKNANTYIQLYTIIYNIPEPDIHNDCHECY